ncbi:MAG: hypothetical protein HY854_24795 [Burkholderiales bacterium]|nr:hypothetical protein [Burkholderiales bacterium]
MISQDLKHCIDRVEACTDEARRAMQAQQAQPALHEAMELLHTRARQAQQEASSVEDDTKMRHSVNQLEKAADRALQQGQSATNLTPQMLQALQAVHAEASKLKKWMESRLPA